LARTLSKEYLNLPLITDKIKENYAGSKKLRLTIERNAINVDKLQTLIIKNNKIRHLPVVDKEECLIGLFSLRLFLDEIFRMQ